jgi:hypothetical protein
MWQHAPPLRDIRFVVEEHEGTNEIQALDLLLRKVLPEPGFRLGLLTPRSPLPFVAMHRA